MANTKITLTMELDVTDVEPLMRVTHHAEELLDLDSWPEIVEVRNVRIEEA